MSEKTKMSAIQAVFSLILVAAGGWYFFGGGLEQQASKDMHEIENTVAADAVAQYEIAKRNGSAVDACVQAGMVSAAYLQAKNEAQYAAWKATEKADCKLAGVPQ